MTDFTDIPSCQDFVIVRLGHVNGIRITPDGHVFVYGVERVVSEGKALYDAINEVAVDYVDPIITKTG